MDNLPLANGETCPFCRGKALRYFKANDHTSPRKISIVECLKCDIAWQWPLACDSEAGLSFFNEQYAAGGEKDEEYFSANRKEAVAKLQMDFVSKVKPVPGQLLDVGAGMGYFVKAAKDSGWDAIGVEPSSAGAAQAATVEGITVINGLLSDLPQDQLFDVITMWDVIEHVDNPGLLIHQAFQKLRSGGWLVVETGNYQSYERLELGKNWWLWQFDHKWYFSPDVMEQLLKQVGVGEVIHADTVFRPGFKRAQKSRPSLIYRVKKSVKAPWRSVAEIQTYLKLRRGYKKWPSWINFPIFTIAASKPETASN